MNNIKKLVAIIGIGNLGLRHLESLVCSNMNLEIYSLDPSDSSILRAKKHLANINYDKKLVSVQFVNDFKASNNLSDKFMSFFGSPEWSPKSN